MMMLDCDEWEAAFLRPLPRPGGRKVARMQIMDDGLWLNFEGAHQVVKRLAEELQAGQVFQIAQMLALIDKAAPRQRKDIFQVAADGEKRRCVKGQRDAQRH